MVLPTGTIFAYGQTSSGKTYTMSGVIAMAIQDVFHALAAVGVEFTSALYFLFPSTAAVLYAASGTRFRSASKLR